MKNKTERTFESYYDGIDPKKQAIYDKMTLKELEMAIEKEKERCKRLEGVRS